MYRRLLIAASLLLISFSHSFAQNDNDLWATNFGPTGVSGTVKAMKQWGDTLVVAGDIAGLRQTAAISPGFVMFDLVERSWRLQVAEQMDLGDEVRAVEVLPNGDLVVGGDFSFTADGYTLDNIAVYSRDGTWSTLSGDTSDLCDGPVNALLEFEGRLYIGGEFFEIGNVDTVFTSFFAIWDETGGFLGGNEPLGFGGGPGSTPAVHALVHVPGPSGSQLDQRIYIGGSFLQFPGDTLGNIVYLETFDRSVFSPVGGGTNGPVYTLARPGNSSYDHELYVGGEFTIAGGILADNAAILDTDADTWDDLGGGFNGPVYAAHQYGTFFGGMQFAGAFDSVGGVPSGSLPRWSIVNDEWTVTDVRADAPGYALEGIQFENQSSMAFGGEFEFAGDSGRYHGVFQFNYVGSDTVPTLHALGDGLDRDGFSPAVNAVAADDSGNFYITGAFDHAGGKLCNNIAKWDGETWHPLGDGLEGFGVEIAVSGDTVYVVHALPFPNSNKDEVLRWDGNAWSAISPELPYVTIKEFELDTLGNLYLVGRNLDTIGLSGAQGIIKWDGNQWSEVGGPMDHPTINPIVNDMYIDPMTNDVYVCGQFQTVDSVVANNIARWNGTFWFGLGNVATDTYGPHLIGRAPEGPIVIGGFLGDFDFRQQYQTTAWIPYAGGRLSPGSWTDLLTIGCHLYATGDPLQFVGDTDDPMRVYNIGRWDGLQWDSLGSGTNGGIFAIAAHGRQLAVAGDFTIAGGGYARGFTIWNGVIDSDNAANFLITSPLPNDTLEYGNVFDITWDTATTAEEAVIEVSYDSGSTWQVIHNHAIAKRGKLTWLIPDTNAAFCQIRLSDGDQPCLKATPNFTFTITADSALESHWLQRAGGTYYDEPFTIGYHNWNFSNGKGNIWPDTFTQNIDYSNFPEPPGKIINFPDWFAFCEAFGPDYCYKGGDPDRVRSKALKFWKSILTEWGGSCYGFTQTALLRFKYKSWNLGFFLPWDDLYFEDLNTFYRNVINKYWIYQKGEKFNDFEDEGFALGPVASMQKIRDGFVADYPRGLSFFYRQWDTVMVNDTVAQPVDSVWTQKGHSVVPYRIFEWPDTTGIYYMYVYDNNAPNDTNRIVRIDSVNNWWRFVEYYPRDTTPGLMPDPNVLEYETYATDDPVGPFRMPLAEDKTTVLTSATENIVMTNGSGQRVGWLGNELLLEDSASIPLIPRDPGYQYLYPQGYYIPDGEYTIELSKFTDSTTNIFFDADSIAYGYTRSGAAYDQLDRLAIGDGISAMSGSGGIKTFSLSTITTTPTVDRLIELSELTMAGIDSVQMTVDSVGAITLWNTGINKAYKLLLWNSDIAMAEDEITQSTGFTTIFAGETHKIVPAWGMLESMPTLLLKDTEQDGIFEDTSVLAIVTDIEDDLPELPDTYELSQNYPNPFNPSTTIDFSLPVAGEVTLEIINILGQRVKVLVDKELAAGSYTAEWNGTNESDQAVATGIYFYRLTADGFSKSKKMLLLK